MVSAQVSSLVAVALIAAASGCLIRLAILNLLAVYPALVFFLFSQIATTVLSYIANVRTEGYAWGFLLLLAVEWVSYALVIRELYNSIFSRFPGIAILGQWSLYGALLATIAIFAFEIAPVERRIAQLSTRIPAVEFASHCLLFSFAAFIAILLFAVSRYPLRLHKNIVLNCVFFSLILLGEVFGLIANQATSRHLTANLNVIISLSGTLFLSAWAALLSREGEMQVLPPRGKYSPGDEARLLDQLSTVNALLLRTARR